MQILTLNQADRQRNYERDYIVIGCTPYDEDCTQAGQDADNSIMECKALINQIRREHGQEPDGCTFFVLHNFHDFGEYYEAAIFFKQIIDIDWNNVTGQESTLDEILEHFSDEQTESETYALKCEQLPEKWDAEALKELREQNYFIRKPQAAKVIDLTGKSLASKKAN